MRARQLVDRDSRANAARFCGTTTIFVTKEERYKCLVRLGKMVGRVATKLSAYLVVL